MPECCPNLVLQRCLTELGWTPERLALRVNAYAQRQGVKEQVHVKTPYGWLLYGRTPREPWRSLVAAVISEHAHRRISVHDLGWEQPRSFSRIPAHWGLSEEGSPMVLLRALDEMGSDSVERRDFFLTTSSAGLALTTENWELGSAIEQPETTNKINSETLNAIDTFLHHLRVHDDAAGGGSTLASARGELNTVVGMIKNGKSPRGAEKRLYVAAAELARLVGWCVYDMGQLALGQRYCFVGLEAARHGGSIPTGANVLRTLAIQVSQAGNPEDAVKILDAARRAADHLMTPTERAGIQCTYIRVYGRLGDRNAARAAGDNMFEFMAQIEGTQRPGYSYWVEPAELCAWVGDAEFRFGALEKAESNLQTAIVHADGSKLRERASWLCSLSHLYLKKGEIEQSCQAADDAIEALRLVNSSRVQKDVNQLRQELSKYKNSPAVRTFDEKAKAVLSMR